MGAAGSAPHRRDEDDPDTDDQSLFRRLLLGLGAVLAILGLAVVSGALPSFRLNFEWWHVTAAGAVGAIIGLRMLIGGIRTPRRYIETADPERPVPVRTPGVEVTDLLAEFHSPSSGSIADRRRIRKRLYEAVHTVLTRFEGYSEDGAADLLASGQWTDDLDAAGFLDDTHRPATRSRRERLRQLIRPESDFQRRARRVVETLGDRTALSGGPLPQAVTRAARADVGERGRETEPFEGLQATNRWRGIGAVGLIALGVGVFLRQPSALLVGLLGVGLAGYTRAGSVDALPVDVDRQLSDDDPQPGDKVTVRLEVQNVGSRLLPDLRILDGVPAALSVTQGSPRLGVGLRPGKTAVLEYTLTARLGRHEFEPVRFIGRDLSGSLERSRTVDAPTPLRCRPTIAHGDTVPLRPHATGVTGRITTRTGGPGTEFHSVREYRRGDPVNRLDWNHLARTGELTTVLFREENVATVMIVIDARSAAYRSPSDATVHAVDRSLLAAAKTAGGFFEAGNRVGMAALGPRPGWLESGVGADHTRTVEAMLGESEAFAPTPPTGGFSPLRWVRRFRRRVPGDAQVVLLSPMTDETAPLIARWLEGYGHPVSVISPDPTDAGSVGQLLARIERTGRLAGLRERGITVVDWGWAEPLEVALDRVSHR